MKRIILLLLLLSLNVCYAGSPRASIIRKRRIIAMQKEKQVKQIPQNSQAPQQTSQIVNHIHSENILGWHSKIKATG